MKLGEYLHKNSLSMRDFATQLSVSVETIKNILYERGYISSKLARRIYEHTEQQVSIQDLILMQAGYERCPCCSQTLSDYEKVDQIALEAAKVAKKEKELKAI